MAICYWGLTRSTRLVYATHKQHVRDILEKAGIDYDVYLHTWSTIAPYTWENRDRPQDETEYMLLEPTVYRRDNQDEFLESINFDEYWDKERFNRLGCYYEWYPYLVRNMLCALESQRRLTNMVLESNKEYDFVMFIRPDVSIHTSFPVAYLHKLGPKDILIPDDEHHGGYNDRFAVMRWPHFQFYGLRFNDIQEGRAAEPKQRLAAETFMKFIIDKYYEKVYQIPFKFTIVRAP